MAGILNISLVLYCPDWEGEVLPLVGELLRVKGLRRICLLDNSPLRAEAERLRQFPLADKHVRYIHMASNMGYGRAHNVALRDSIYHQTPLHLVLNSDILLRAEDVDTLVQFMLSQPEVGQLMPHVTCPDGQTQYLCKLLPTPLDVFGRRFLPTWLMAHRNARYELRHTGYDRPMNVPYLSGCFMLLRTEAATQAGLFDERYFMYPEDVDLTRTIHRNWLTLYYPAVSIVHNHRRSSYKNKHMLWIHIQNMCRYFNKWGWWFDSERRRFNRETLRSVSKS